MMKRKELSVRLYGKPVGVLEQSHAGIMRFTYLPNAQQAISLSMPIRLESYEGLVCEAFFGGLLPENPEVRQAIGRQVGVNPDNNFSLLRAIGHDCAGAISIHEIDEPVHLEASLLLKGKVLTDSELVHHIKALPQKPLFFGVEGLRLSLAGVQDKAAVCLINNKIAIPQDASPSTYILKPALARFPDSVLNEYFCLQLASKVGINCPDVEVRQVKDITFLLIKRYDRIFSASGTGTRIHQEDFCQALGIVSVNKYQADGGPSVADCFKLLLQVNLPALDRRFLMQYVIFNYLIGNHDAHGKNFSLLHHPNNFIQLAPLYDAMCTEIYTDLTDKMAMKIGGHYGSHEILPRHWEKLCHDIGFSLFEFKKMLQAQLETILPAAKLVTANMQKLGLDIAVANKISQHLTARCRLIKTRFSW